jgi:hypothetical protein
MNQIIKDVFTKPDKCTENNCAFVVAVVNIIFDPEIQTTSLSRSTISKHMNMLLDNYKQVFKYYSILLV